MTLETGNWLLDENGSFWLLRVWNALYGTGTCVRVRHFAPPLVGSVKSSAGKFTIHCGMGELAATYVTEFERRLLEVTESKR